MTRDKFELLKKNFYDTQIADILRAVDGRSLLGSLTLSLISIDSIAMALNPQEMITRGSCFEDYIQKYLRLIDVKYFDRMNEIKYIRNALCHTYGETEKTLNYRGKSKLNFSFSFELNRLAHLNLTKSNEPAVYQIHFCIPNLIIDVISSAYWFFNDIESDLANKGDQVEKWNSLRIKILGNTNYENRSYADFHPLLSSLDKPWTKIEDLRTELDHSMRKLWVIQ